MWGKMWGSRWRPEIFFYNFNSLVEILRFLPRCRTFSIRTAGSLYRREIRIACVKLGAYPRALRKRECEYSDGERRFSRWQGRGFAAGSGGCRSLARGGRTQAGFACALRHPFGSPHAMAGLSKCSFEAADNAQSSVTKHTCLRRHPSQTKADGVVANRAEKPASSWVRVRAWERFLGWDHGGATEIAPLRNPRISAGFRSWCESCRLVKDRIVALRPIGAI